MNRLLERIVLSERALNSACAPMYPPSRLKRSFMVRVKVCCETEEKHPNLYEESELRKVSTNNHHPFLKVQQDVQV